MKHTLLLGSKSASRKMLLTQAHIPFTIVEQNCDETVCDVTLPFPLLVSRIASDKMSHVILPAGKHEGEICFVLTADTMVQDKSGVIHGKPVDRNDAIAKLKAAAEGSYLCTAFCLDRKIWKEEQWKLQERIQEVVAAEYIFIVPSEWIDSYIDNVSILSVAGAVAVEDFGSQFLKMVTGSYTSLIGLPLFELRQALERIGFFKK